MPTKDFKPITPITPSTHNIDLYDKVGSIKDNPNPINFTPVKQGNGITGISRSSAVPLRTMDEFSGGVVEGENPYEIRAQHQGLAKKYANSFARIVPGIALNFTQGLGQVGGIALSPFVYAFGGDPMAVINDNFIAKGSKDANQWIKDTLFPIYHTEQYQQSDNALYKVLGEGAEGFTDGIAFLGSAMIPGFGFSKAFKIGAMTTKLLSRSNRLAKLGKVKEANKLIDTAKSLNSGIKDINIASKSGIFARNQKAIEKGIDYMNLHLYNTMSESSFEAHEARNAVFKNHIWDTDEEGNLISNSELDELQYQAWKKSFGWNMALLALTNIPETAAMFNVFSKARMGAKKAYSIANKANTKVSKTLDFLKPATINALSEGILEEGTQLAIQNSIENSIANETTIGEDLFYIGTNVLENFGTTEGREAMLTGALIGFLFGGTSGYVDNQSRKNDAAIKLLNRDIRNLQIKDIGLNIFETETVENETKDENGEIVKKKVERVKLEDGKPKLDLAKIKVNLNEIEEGKRFDSLLLKEAFNQNSSALYNHFQKRKFVDIMNQFVLSESDTMVINDDIEFFTQEQQSMIDALPEGIIKDNLQQEFNTLKTEYTTLATKMQQVYKNSSGKAFELFANNMIEKEDIDIYANTFYNYELQSLLSLDLIKNLDAEITTIESKNENLEFATYNRTLIDYNYSLAELDSLKKELKENPENKDELQQQIKTLESQIKEKQSKLLKESNLHFEEGITKDDIDSLKLQGFNKKNAEKYSELVAFEQALETQAKFLINKTLDTDNLEQLKTTIDETNNLKKDLRKEQEEKEKIFQKNNLKKNILKDVVLENGTIKNKNKYTDIVGKYDLQEFYDNHIADLERAAKVAETGEPNVPVVDDTIDESEQKSEVTFLGIFEEVLTTETFISDKVGFDKDFGFDKTNFEAIVNKLFNESLSAGLTDRIKDTYLHSLFTIVRKKIDTVESKDAALELFDKGIALAIEGFEKGGVQAEDVVIIESFLREKINEVLTKRYDEQTSSKNDIDNTKVTIVNNDRVFEINLTEEEKNQVAVYVSDIHDGSSDKVNSKQEQTIENIKKLNVGSELTIVKEEKQYKREDKLALHDKNGNKIGYLQRQKYLENELKVYSEIDKNFDKDTINSLLLAYREKYNNAKSKNDIVKEFAKELNIEETKENLKILQAVLKRSYFTFNGKPTDIPVEQFYKMLQMLSSEHSIIKDIRAKFKDDSPNITAKIKTFSVGGLVKGFTLLQDLKHDNKNVHYVYRKAGHLIDVATGEKIENVTNNPVADSYSPQRRDDGLIYIHSDKTLNGEPILIAILPNKLNSKIIDELIKNFTILAQESKDFKQKDLSDNQKAALEIFDEFLYQDKLSDFKDKNAKASFITDIKDGKGNPNGYRLQLQSEQSSLIAIFKDGKMNITIKDLKTNSITKVNPKNNNKVLKSVLSEIDYNPNFKRLLADENYRNEIFSSDLLYVDIVPLKNNKGEVVSFTQNSEGKSPKFLMKVSIENTVKNDKVEQEKQDIFDKQEQEQTSTEEVEQTQTEPKREEDNLLNSFGIPDFTFTNAKNDNTILTKKNITLLKNTMKKFKNVYGITIDYTWQKYHGKVILGSYNKETSTILLHPYEATLRTLLHELTHPFVTALNINNRELFDTLLHQAEANYPELKEQIDAIPEYTITMKEEELIVKALEREYQVSDLEAINKRDSLWGKFLTFLNNIFKPEKYDSKTRLKTLTPDSSLRDIIDIIISSRVPLFTSKDAKMVKEIENLKEDKLAISDNIELYNEKFLSRKETLKNIVDIVTFSDYTFEELGITQEDWNNLTTEEKERIKNCNTIK